MNEPQDSQQPNNIDPRDIEHLRQSFAKSIHDFKQAVLKNLPNHDDQGPLKEHLRQDVELPSVDPSDVIPVIRPVVIQQTDIIPAAQLEQWVSEEKPGLHAQGVHAYFTGIDNQVNSKVRTFLQKMGVRTFLPTLSGDVAGSILEQFVVHPDFNFAVVVLSADQYMYARHQDPRNALFITDPKTIFELGYLVGKLGRNRVAVFYEESDQFKRPTEFFDILYIPFDAAGHWQQQLVHYMSACGIEIHQELKVVV